MTTVSIEVDRLDAEIGERVHMLMFRRRVTGRALAGGIGVTPSVLSKKLRGTSAWSARQVADAAGVLRVSVSELYGEVPSTGPTPEQPTSKRKVAGSNPAGGSLVHLPTPTPGKGPVYPLRRSA